MIEAKPGDARGFLHKSKFGRFIGQVGERVAFGGGGKKGVIRIGEELGGPFAQAATFAKRLTGGPPPSQFVPFVFPPGTPGTDVVCRPRESTRCCDLRNGSIADQQQWQRECGTAGEPQPQFGGAEMGQFGAGLQPASFTTTTRVCPRGAVLGMDGLCYNKRDLRNADRMWPRGTRPLLTGGEMRCIRIASSASNKLRRKQKQLEKMGMLPKPTRRARSALPSGHHAHVAHD